MAQILVIIQKNSPSLDLTNADSARTFKTMEFIVPDQVALLDLQLEQPCAVFRPLFFGLGNLKCILLYLIIELSFFTSVFCKILEEAHFLNWPRFNLPYFLIQDPQVLIFQSPNAGFIRKHKIFTNINLLELRELFKGKPYMMKYGNFSVICQRLKVWCTNFFLPRFCSFSP